MSDDRLDQAKNLIAAAANDACDLARLLEPGSQAEAFANRIVAACDKAVGLLRSTADGPSEEEAAARAICDVWGYLWDAERSDPQAPGDHGNVYDERPSKVLFRKAARAALRAAAESREGR